LELARAGTPRNEIARQVGVGAGSVSRICSAAGVSFERAGTESATRARRVDLAARRMALSGDLLDDVDAARRWLAGAADARELRDAANAIHSLAGAHARLATVPPDHGEELDHSRSLLGALLVGLQVAHGTGE
jgi:hypothetical protein